MKTIVARDSKLLFSPDYDVESCELYACCRICFIKISPFLAIWSSVSDPDLNHNFLNFGYDSVTMMYRTNVA